MSATFVCPSPLFRVDHWDLGYWAPVLQQAIANPHSPLPRYSEVSKQISGLVLCLRNGLTAEVRKYTNVSCELPPVMNAESMDEREYHFHAVADCLMLCTDVEQYLNNHQQPWTLLHREIPRLRALLEIITEIVGPSRHQNEHVATEEPVTADDDLSSSSRDSDEAYFSQNGEYSPADSPTFPALKPYYEREHLDSLLSDASDPVECLEEDEDFDCDLDIEFNPNLEDNSAADVYSPDVYSPDNQAKWEFDIAWKPFATAPIDPKKKKMGKKTLLKQKHIFATTFSKVMNDEGMTATYFPESETVVNPAAFFLSS